MARTPTPSSMLALPSLTMPSSSAQDSSRETWKYRSAESIEWSMTRPRTRSRRPSSRPPGERMDCRARAKLSCDSLMTGILSQSRVQPARCPVTRRRSPTWPASPDPATHCRMANRPQAWCRRSRPGTSAAPGPAIAATSCSGGRLFDQAGQEIRCGGAAVAAEAPAVPHGDLVDLDGLDGLDLQRDDLLDLFGQQQRGGGPRVLLALVTSAL